MSSFQKRSQLYRILKKCILKRTCLPTFSIPISVIFHADNRKKLHQGGDLSLQTDGPSFQSKSTHLWLFQLQVSAVLGYPFRCPKNVCRAGEAFEQTWGEERTLVENTQRRPCLETRSLLKPKLSRASHAVVLDGRPKKGTHCVVPWSPSGTCWSPWFGQARTLEAAVPPGIDTLHLSEPKPITVWTVTGDQVDIGSKPKTPLAPHGSIVWLKENGCPNVVSNGQQFGEFSTEVSSTSSPSYISNTGEITASGLGATGSPKCLAG